MCIDCKARLKMARDALIAGKIVGTIAHVAKGAAEIVGVKEKTGAQELALEEADRSSPNNIPASPVINAHTGHIAQEKYHG